MTPAWDEVTAQASAIVAGAEQHGVTLRVLGSAGIRLHCAATGPLMDALDRPVKDIDLLVPEKQRKPMRRYLESLGYITDRDVLIAMEGTRYCFKHPDGGAELDVFVEKLNFCHPVEVRARLALHPVTLPIEELMLAKLQIVELTTTDVMDLGVILATHDIGPVGDTEVIDAGHIAGLFSKDWGFHHTATKNLRQIDELTAGRHAKVAERVDRLLGAIDAEPKSLAWRMRDKVGERKQWWQDVDEKEATY
ncbi:MAG TPA: hypothetical protein VFI65_17205 [Streptosporangiaceae bacterium]|nr:hypothetical protein [Streptosporangiaceae bacterium]